MAWHCGCPAQKTIARSLTIIVRECVSCRAYHYYSIDLEGREVNIDEPDAPPIQPSGGIVSGIGNGPVSGPPPSEGGEKMPSPPMSEFDPS
jgi:hypothetical protein